MTMADGVQGAGSSPSESQMSIARPIALLRRSDSVETVPVLFDTPMEMDLCDTPPAPADETMIIDSGDESDDEWPTCPFQFQPEELEEFRRAVRAPGAVKPVEAAPIADTATICCASSEGVRRRKPI